jgi:hypothetical protein
MSGQRRAEAERQERRSRPVRIVAIAIIAVLLIGIVGSVIASSFDSTRRETVTVDGSEPGETVEIPFDDGISPLVLAGLVMVVGGVGILGRTLMWGLFRATSPPRRAARPSAWFEAMQRWGTRVGFGLVGIGLIVIVVGNAID